VLWTHGDGTVEDATATFAAGTPDSPVVVHAEGDIVFCGGTWYTQLDADADVRVSSPEGAPAVLDGGGVVTIVAVEEDGLDVSLEGLSLEHGYATVIEPNNAYAAGGGIGCTGYSTLTLTDVDIESSSGGLGGAIFSSSCDVSLTRGTLQGNTASYGAAIFAYGGQLHVEETTIADNVAAVTGGAIAMEGVREHITFDLVDPQIMRNTAIYGGGVSVLYDIAASCTGSSGVASGITANTADYGGGVLLYGGSTFDVRECDFGTDADGDDNVTTDVYVYDLSASYEYGTDASFACTTSGGCA
jgi:hypothetical protein